MDPLIDMSAIDWADWIRRYPDAEEDVKLSALRNYIERAARKAHSDDPDRFTAAWVSKKLRKLGVDAQIPAANTYVLKAPVHAEPISLTISAANRDEAIRNFLDRLAGRPHLATVEAASDPEIVDGPEDVVPDAAPDAPATVGDTLAKLRETILLSTIAGPKACVPGANEVLESFGLAPVPERKRFTVTRPVQGFGSTQVEAFDEASALRVAAWRWEDNSGWRVKVSDIATYGDMVAVEDV